DSRRLVVWISTGILGFQGATLAFDLLNCTAMGWLYANEFKENCTNCNEAMQQTAKIVAIDALLRVGEGRAAAMIQKTLPPPDLSSSPARPK
ncbi:hypothetical protein EBR21_17810, partial [bacterium]|nr:hypothetical protein [bacterium]